MCCCTAASVCCGTAASVCCGTVARLCCSSVALVDLLGASTRARGQIGLKLRVGARSVHRRARRAGDGASQSEQSKCRVALTLASQVGSIIVVGVHAKAVGYGCPVQRRVIVAESAVGAVDRALQALFLAGCVVGAAKGMLMRHAIDYICSGQHSLASENRLKKIAGNVVDCDVREPAKQSNCGVPKIVPAHFRLV